MTTFAGIDVAGMVASAFESASLPSLSVVVPGTDTVDPTTRTVTAGATSTYTVRGIVSSVSERFLDSFPEAQAGDKEILVALGSFKDSAGAAASVTPERGWSLVDSGVNLRVVEILDADPAGGTMTLLVRR